MMGRQDVDWASVDWTKNNTQISKDTGWSTGTVGRRRRECGAKPLKKGRPRGRDLKWLEAAREMRAAGKSYQKIADEVGVTRQRVHAVLSVKEDKNGES